MRLDIPPGLDLLELLFADFHTLWLLSQAWAKRWPPLERVTGLEIIGVDNR